MTLLLAVIVTALLIVIGGYLLRDTPIREVRERGGQGRIQAAGPPMQRAFEVLARASLERGNRIELLPSGDHLFPRLFHDLESAERLITWQVFWFKPGRLADRLAEVLRDRARAGVEVLMLLDAFGAKGLPKEYVTGLRDGGVDVRTYRPLRWKSLYKFPHRSHVRSVVVDSRVGYTGGFGIDDRWAGNGREPGSWHDTHVRIEGPAVDQLQAPFLANWAECTGRLVVGDGVLGASPVSDGEAQRAAVLYSSPSLGSTGAERFLALTVSAARKTLYIKSAYFVPSSGFRNLLCRAAAADVDVRVLTAGRHTDEPLARYAGRVHYGELLAAGIRIYEYVPTMMHAKTVVADGTWAAVGSMNFDNRSLKLNDEVTVVVQDEGIGSALTRAFVDDLGFATEIGLAELRERPRHVRIRDRAAWLIAPLL